MMQEEPLAGGRTTPGVVRVGDTVRRPPQRNSEFARALLAYLAGRGFDGAPRFLGVDQNGRECFSFIAGRVPDELGHFDDGVIDAAARLIRAYHDATVGFSPDAEVICHNDLSPCNSVFVDGIPIALIDFDAAEPGMRLRDLGYAAWLWLDIGNDELSREEQLRRLSLFVGAYDASLDVSRVIDSMMERQRLLAAELGDPGRTAWASACLTWTADNLAS